LRSELSVDVKCFKAFTLRHCLLCWNSAGSEGEIRRRIREWSVRVRRFTGSSTWCKPRTIKHLQHNNNYVVIINDIC